LSERDEVRGARGAGTEAYINDMLRLRAPRNEAIRPLRQLISVSLYVNFYSYQSMQKRLPPPATTGNVASWVINLSQRKVAKMERMETFDDF
jgi:hypothetical protein